jgi:hypothetical protein
MSEQPVIEKDEMMAPMLVACPSFQEHWQQFLTEWVDNPILYEDGGDGSLPHYLTLCDLANHLILKLETGDTDEFAAVFEVVEDWIVRGSHYVSEAAVVGLLENLTNEAQYYKKKVSDFVPWMGPTTRKWLPEVVDFWERLDKGNFRPLSID